MCVNIRKKGKIMMMTVDEKPKHNAKVRIVYTDRGIISEAIGYYRFCGTDYGFVAAGFWIPDEQIIGWEYVNI